MWTEKLVHKESERKRGWGGGGVREATRGMTGQNAVALYISLAALSLAREADAKFICLSLGKELCDLFCRHLAFLT